MSLDVYLKVAEKIPYKGSGVFIRVDGQTKEITESEWQTKYLDREPFKYDSGILETNEVFHYNITHNLGMMAQEAGLYQPLWRPEEIDVSIAIHLIVPLSTGLETLLKDPDHYKKFNPENGWGNYEGFVEFVKAYLKACIDYPDAEIIVSR